MGSAFRHWPHIEQQMLESICRTSSGGLKLLNMYWNDEAGTLTVACWSQELQCSLEYFLLISTAAAYIIIRLHCMQCKLQCKKGWLRSRVVFFISRVLFSPPSPTSELHDRQLCGVIVNCLQIVIMDTSGLYGSWSASVRSYRILMWTGPTGG